MIYFKNTYIEMAKGIINESREFIEIKQELERIDTCLNQIEKVIVFPENNSEKQYVMQFARELNEYFRRKYPIIDDMLMVAEMVPKKQKSTTDGSSISVPQEYTALKQDRCGILCHVILKKNITNSLKDIIDYVDYVKE